MSGWDDSDVLTQREGDLAEQHPQLLRTLLISAATFFVPQAWILGKLLGLFGFGVQGPIKGTYSIILICCVLINCARQVRQLRGPRGSSLAPLFLRVAGSRSSRSWE